MTTAAPSLLKDPRGRRAVIVGGGRTGAAAALLLGRLGAHVRVVDDGARDKVEAGLRAAGLEGVEIVAGGIPEAELVGAELILLSPGVPRAHPAVAAALARGVPVFNEIELAAAHLPDSVAVLAITGTNGKSTTTTMAGAIAQQADPHAFVGGNLGTPYCRAALAHKEGAPAPRFAVLELSSYQLETLRHLAVRAAVVTNLTPDHLDRYPSAEAYYAAKARVLGLVAAGGGVSLNAADPVSRAFLFPLVTGGLVPCHFDSSLTNEGVQIDGGRLRCTAPLVDLSLANPHIVGHHNRQNAAAAVAGALLAGVPLSACQPGLDAYAGIAHRLERVGSARDIAWFNDSKATNVDAAVTALRSFTGGVHLIAGGLGKGAPYAPLAEAGRGVVRAVYTIGADAEPIAKAFAGVAEVVPSETLERACRDAHARAQPGDVILLSPACASFDQFRDYAQRGESFRALFFTVTGAPPPAAGAAAGDH